MSTTVASNLPAPGAPTERVALDEVLTRARLLALRRFPTMTEALEAFFEMAAQLSHQAWPEPVVPAPETDASPDEAAEDEAVPDSGAALSELLVHLERMEELLEALEKA